jgi:hypothetical protein
MFILTTKPTYVELFGTYYLRKLPITVIFIML